MENTMRDTEYTNVNVKVEIHKEDDTFCISTITVEVPIYWDDWEREFYVEEDYLPEAVSSYLGDKDYEIINWFYK